MGFNNRNVIHNIKGDLMFEVIENKEIKDKCIIQERNSQGNLNLCCCYIVDSNGRYVDPCYHPVTDCC